MQIEGTSTIHDWECEVEEINADVKMNTSTLEGESISNPVQSLSITIPVEEIESGKGGMNKKIYGALKEKDYPNITYILSAAELVNGSSNKSFILNTNGKLTVAGNTQNINFPVEGTLQDDGSYRFTGSYTLNMKDYDVDPPSAMLGTIRSGEEVTIKFEIFVDQQ